MHVNNSTCENNGVKGWLEGLTQGLDTARQLDSAQRLTVL